MVCIQFMMGLKILLLKVIRIGVLKFNFKTSIKAVNITVK